MYNPTQFMNNLNATVTRKLNDSGLTKRMDNVLYALACDDEVNAHYNLTPSRWFRAKLAVVSFFN